MKGRTKWSDGIIAILAAWMIISFMACGSDSPLEEQKPDKPAMPDKPDTPDEPQVEVSAPVITVLMSESCVFGCVKVEQADSLLLIGTDAVASWSMGNSKLKALTLTFNGTAISLGTVLSEKGMLSLTVTNEADKSSNCAFTLTDEAILGLNNLGQLPLQVDQETDLLQGLTLAKGFELVKTEMEFEGQRTAIADVTHFTPQYPGPCTLFFTVKRNGNEGEVKAENLTIKPLDYRAIEVKNIKPVDILPIIGLIESGDKRCYEHIEHLRVAEATRIRDMMWEYGAGNHNAEEYKQLMNRLNTGMTRESPSGFDNYEVIGGEIIGTPSSHARCLRSILNIFINHAKFRVDDPLNDRASELSKFIKDNPNSINIFGNSTYSSANNKSDYNKIIYSEIIKNLCNLKNCIIFAAGTNINRKDGHLRNKIYNGEYEGDEYGWYSLASMSNSDNNTQPNTHLLVTIATNKDGNIDQTDVDRESSKYPVGFANNVLFSGRGFPEDRDGKIYGPSGRYATSDTNYFNVALTDLCFQMFAEVKDVDKLLGMIRSTALTDYIRLDGQTQELQLINPAGFFQKYLMPTTESLSVKLGETLNLEKGYYHGVIFDIPGAEVFINGEWIPYNANNATLIKAQNPMTLEWRLNADLLRKLGYKQGDTLTGHILVVDDEWNGLNITKDISVRVE